MLRKLSLRSRRSRGAIVLVVALSTGICKEPEEGLGHSAR